MSVLDKVGSTPAHCHWGLVRPRCGPLSHRRGRRGRLLSELPAPRARMWSLTSSHRTRTSP